MLIIGAVACVVLYIALCGLFNMVRKASLEGVRAQEEMVASIAQ